MYTTCPFLNIDLMTRQIGAELRDVHYWCLKHEASAEEIESPHFFLGGVVKLTLGYDNLYLTWKKEPGRPITSGLSIESNARWETDYYRDFNVSDTPTWKPHLGSLLRQVDFLGWRGVVSIAAFSFQTGIMYIGTGNGDVFGYGDDVLIRSQEYFWQSPHIQDLEVLHTIRHREKPYILMA